MRLEIVFRALLDGGRLGSRNRMIENEIVRRPKGVGIDPLMGRQIHHLTVIAPASESPKGTKRYFVRCQCGTEMLLYERQVSGNAMRKSCGCRGKATGSGWSEEQLGILRREYPKVAGRCTVLIGRSRAQVRRKAGMLGIKFVGQGFREGQWTAEEDEIIRQHYPRGGTAACLPFLPTRSKSAARDRAHHLGVKCPRENIPCIWTDEERAHVRRHYRKGGWKAVAKYLPHRSGDSITAIAHQMGLHVKMPWSAKDNREFRKLYEEGGSVRCMERWPEKSVDAIRSKARTLGVRYDKNYWSEEEDQIAREKFPLGGWKAVHALLPHRGERAIHAYCTKYKIRYIGWTEEEDAILREHYPTMGRACVDLLPRRTHGAVRSRAHTLGLSWFRKWNSEDTEVLRAVYPEGGVAAVCVALPHRNAESVRSKAYQLGLRLSKAAYSRQQSKAAIKIAA